MSDAPKPPQRAVTLTLTIGADSDEELGREWDREQRRKEREGG